MKESPNRCYCHAGTAVPPHHPPKPTWNNPGGMDREEGGGPPCTPPGVAAYTRLGGLVLGYPHATNERAGYPKAVSPSSECRLKARS